MLLYANKYQYAGGEEIKKMSRTTGRRKNGGRIGLTTGSASDHGLLGWFTLVVRLIKSDHCDLVSKNSSKSKGGTIWVHDS